MRQLLYVSNTSRDFPEENLKDILEAARRNNAAKHVTGMLLYLDGAFLQVLEGPADAVEEIYQAIRADKRHWNPLILLDREASRAFADWSMGFERLLGDGGHAFELNQSAINEKISSDAAIDLPKLIDTFYRINRPT